MFSQEGDAAGYSWVPSVGQIAQAGPWVGYAIAAEPTAILIFANSWGCVCAYVFLGLFVAYSKTQRQRLTIIGWTALVTALIVVFYLILFANPLPHAKQVAGIITGAVGRGYEITHSNGNDDL
jgi:hypothetical protein